ncbi:hypothetical protein T484DRAFT_1749905 [Baffinella frigidus]|nr:hypothetical protein T484DRAFT_1749905 [Cryptophyta sp. CCMP2293]
MMHFIHKTNSGLLLPDQFGLAPHASYPCAQAYHSNTAMVRAEDLEMAAHASMGAPFPGFSSQPIMSLQEIEALLSSSSTASLLPTPSSDNLGGALDDLAARFILNCPSEPDELQGNDEMMLLMFEVEKAWWFYIDLMMPADASLPALPHRAFAARLFAHCSLLHHVANVDAIFTEWQHYKRTIPTLGAAILSTNLDKVLLVRGFKGSSWGWPKGKVNKDEPDAVCAARESYTAQPRPPNQVFEEIGYDITPLLCEHSSIFVTTAGQKMKLYVIAGVDESTPFETQTRGEIAEIRWHSLKDVTAAARPDAASKSKYFGVAPVLNQP